MSGNNVLLLGGTGPMGRHVCRVLSEGRDRVTITSRSERTSGDPYVTYVRGNARDLGFLASILDQPWDIVIDFMKWGTTEFAKACRLMLRSARRYVFLSSYRVYADALPLTEASPRLLDVTDDQGYLATDEYALAKARCEDILFESGSRNWTIVRPAITYDACGRLQLGPMESETWLWRARDGLRVPFPREMVDRQTTMTWAGDVARLICGLARADVAEGQAYNTSTSEHCSWGQVLACYQEVLPFEVLECGLAEFEECWPNPYQIKYERMYDRVVDNSKALSATGIAQGEMTPIRDGLKSQLEAYLASGSQPSVDVKTNARLDRLVGGFPTIGKVSGLRQIARYARHRLL